ncbi:MAG: aldehyde dehydrogenase family protein [SAR324 cluster bacterium]|nr:aldehyde dehydrogenase family protein [SAR324 cluster bacterium]
MPLNVINPYNQEIFCTLPLEEEVSLSLKLDQAQKAYRQWRKVPYPERERQVKKALEYFEREKDEIARDLTMQMGKPLQQSYNDINTLLDRSYYMISIGEKTLAPELIPESDGLHRRIEHEPLGVVFDIAAWNYPLMIAGNVVIPALLAGNAVLLKHSAKTPLCGAHFQNAFQSLEIPGLMTHLILSHDQTSQVIRDRRVNHLVFTGSVSGGARVYQDAAHQFIEAGLELGGNDPAYVAEDADLDMTVENVIDGACYNAGQSCCAIERVYVHHSIYDEFLKRAKTVLEAYQLGDPMDQKTTMGPLASASALNDLEAQVDEAVQQGARLLLGGKRVEGVKGNFFQPTLIADVPNHAVVMQEESFGPLVPVQSVASDEQALEMMNDTRFGLTASVWTKDPERAEWFARDLAAGTIFQNRSDYCDPALPWTGVGESGKGSSLSPYGFYGLTRRKSINFRR